MVEQQIHPLTNAEAIKPIAPVSQVKKNTAIIILVFVFVLGATTGYIASTIKPNSSQGTGSSTDKPAMVKTDTKAGILDKQTFTDNAVGVLREGGLEGEGSHHLERGAKDQTAYITSSTVDLSPFVGKKVSVWGQTFQSEKAGWFMDVGYVEVVK